MKQDDISPVLPSEFSRRMNLRKLAQEPAVMNLSARADECEALAGRFKIVALQNLSAEVRLEVDETHGEPEYVVEGELEANVTQTCVISLEPFETHVASTFRVRYMSPDAFEVAEERSDSEIVFSAMEEDIEPIPAGELDLGELVAQQLALALDPYPRKPGVEARDYGFQSDEDVEESEPAKRPNPFAVLKKIYDKS